MRNRLGRHALHAFILFAVLPDVRPVSPRIPEVYTVDRSHSLLDFTVRLVGLNRVRGRFEDWRADFTYDAANPAASSVTFVAEVGSVDTGVGQRDEHLRGSDFFDAERFPRIRFQSTSVTPRGDDLLIAGDLTIRDVTRRIEFTAEPLFPEQRDPFGNRRIVFGAAVTLDRTDYGVSGPRFWSSAIADAVTIDMEIAGRIWNYSELGFGSRDAIIGPRLAAAADSGRLDGAIARTRSELANEADSSRFPTAAEIRTAAMRSYQKQRLDDAIKIFELGFATAGARWPAEPRVVNLIGFAEVLYRSGNVTAAGARIAEALRVDSTNTQAAEWRRLIQSAVR